MAIYSCSHSAVGRTTHAAGTAGAHAGYVTRESAARVVVGEHMPLNREAARTWLDGQEEGDRKNARVIDKVMIALPLELDPAERAQLVRDFAAEVGGGRIPWLAGIHDRGKDAHNPHAHVIFRDRDHETGKRVACLSGKGSTEQLRETWERVCNQALERAGSDARVDHRSLAAQGIAKQPGIHVGPNVLAMEERGIRPKSRPQITLDGRVINWPQIDQGRTRLDRQAEIEAANENQEEERDGEKGKGRAGVLEPVGEAEPAKLAPAPAAAPVQEPQGAPQAARTDAPATEVAAPVSDATQRPAQGATEAIPPRDQATADRAPDVSRLRLAIDRARVRLDALGARLDQAFNRLKERLLDQDRQREGQEARRSSPLDAWRKQEKPPETGPGQLRRTIDLWRRNHDPDRSGPER